MSKILTLSSEEAQQLRIHLLQAYKLETGKDFTPVTYLGAYDHLRSFILVKLQIRPEDEASISVHRLRKLFYYTDPAYCTEDKLEALSFGEDFISPLQRIQNRNIFLKKEAETLKDSNRKPGSLRYIAIGAVSALILGTYFLISFKFQKPYYFQDDFNHNSVAELKARGWDIMDFDSCLFFPQDTGVLTLRSSRGDYWVRPGDTPYINNLIFKELPKSECFEVTTKFSFLNNFEIYQQAGIFILDHHKTRNHNIRMTFSHTNKALTRFFQIVKRDHGEATDYAWVETEHNDSTCRSYYFKIVKHDNIFDFYYHCGEGSDAFKLASSMKFNINSEFIALAAFNGMRNSTNGPLNTASSIPAKFDWIKIKECE